MSWRGREWMYSVSLKLSKQICKEGGLPLCNSGLSQQVLEQHWISRGTAAKILAPVWLILTQESLAQGFPHSLLTLFILILNWGVTQGVVICGLEQLDLIDFYGANQKHDEQGRCLLHGLFIMMDKACYNKINDESHELVYALHP